MSFVLEQNYAYYHAMWLETQISIQRLNACNIRNLRRCRSSLIVIPAAQHYIVSILGDKTNG
jgi:hypothetical protein